MQTLGLDSGTFRLGDSQQSVLHFVHSLPIHWVFCDSLTTLSCGTTGTRRSPTATPAVAGLSLHLLDTGQHGNGPIANCSAAVNTPNDVRVRCSYGSTRHDRRQNRSEEKKPWRRLFCGATTSTFTVCLPNSFAASREGM